MKTALITANEPGRVPQVYLDKIRNSGMQLSCHDCKTEEELIEFASDADIIWLFGSPKALTDNALRNLPRCKVLFRSGSGVDCIPWDTATDLGMAICNSPESIAEAVAEHSVALLLAIAKKIPLHNQAIADGDWLTAEKVSAQHISNRTLGLIGYGRIAKLTEKMLSGFNLKVVHHDPFSKHSTDLYELLQVSDFISLHCPLTPETRHLLSEKEFKLMKQNALLINTSRGEVIDEKALIETLNNKEIQGAALDVTEVEPLQKDNPLRKMKNVILTAHSAAFTDDFEKNFWNASVEKLKLFLTEDYRKYSLNIRD